MKPSFGITGFAGAALGVLLAAGTALVGAASPASAAGEAIHIDRQTWSYGGVRGRFDKEQLQRGFQVFQEVCASCHGLKRVYFRNLAEPGGPQFNPEAVKALAASWPNQIFDGPNEQGEIATRRGAIIKRPALPSDPILGPYDNDNQARASQGGALPPDLSLMTKARGIESHAGFIGAVGNLVRDVANGYQESGSDYMHALLTGYVNPPAGFQLAQGMHYNAAFPGHQIAMAAPLSDGRVKYQNKDVPQTVDQYSRDVTAFLAWAADPRHDERKNMGWFVMLYLLVTSVLLYLAKRKLWSKVH